ncbi:PFH16 [Auxenochlorella protothecoides x Auxenochlorella symbiontica]
MAAALAMLVHPAWSKRDEDNLIGWSEDYNAAPGTGNRLGRMKVLSWSPRIFLLQNVLTDDECDHIIKAATPRLERSGVVEVEGRGRDGVSDVRTSYGMFFDRKEDPVLARVENRLSEATMIPVGHGEGIQVLRYENGQEYKPHFDYFFHEAGTDNGGNRLATVLMYLSDVEEGGETVFPNAAVPASQSREAGYSECAMAGLAYRPRKGDAVVFWSLRTDGTLDAGALHGSCPVTKGTKWAATKWYHVAHYAMDGEIPKSVKHVVFKAPRPPAPPGCKDTQKACSDWADGGECDNNPGFMVGQKGQAGACLYSCNRCDLMDAAMAT